MAIWTAAFGTITVLYMSKKQHIIAVVFRHKELGYYKMRNIE